MNITIFKIFCSFVGFSSFLNILRNAGTFKKLRVQFLSYTKYCLPAKNKEHSVILISTWVWARQKISVFKSKVAGSPVIINISIKKIMTSYQRQKDKWNKAPARTFIRRLSEALSETWSLWRITIKHQWYRYSDSSS